MKQLVIGLTAVSMVFCAVCFAMANSFEIPLNPARDPEGTAVHMAYESDTFTIGNPNVHLPGAHLNAPGDRYRQTLFVDCQYAKDPGYEIIRAVAGVHIDDYDWSKDSGDTAPEWGQILINGQPMEYYVPGGKLPPGSSAFVEIAGDLEISAEGGPLLPPYAFVITDIIKADKKIVLEVINLNEQGKEDFSAPFGSFVVNRIGMHVWYKKK